MFGRGAETPIRRRNKQQEDCVVAPRQASDVWVLFRSRIYEQARILSHDSHLLLSVSGWVSVLSCVREAAAAGAAEK